MRQTGHAWIPKSFRDLWNPRSQNPDLGHPGSVVYVPLRFGRDDRCGVIGNLDFLNPFSRFVESQVSGGMEVVAGTLKGKREAASSRARRAASYKMAMQTA